MIIKFINGIAFIQTKIIQYIKKIIIKLIYKNILIDKHTYIGKCVKIKALKGSKIDIRSVYIRDYAYVYANFNAVIEIGKKSQIGRFNTIVAREKIVIGKRTLLAESVTIRDQDHQFDDLNKFNESPIIIGDDVWLAAKVTITRGVSIGNGSVIGAHSVVTKNIPEKSVAVGAPARVIKSI